MCRKTIEVHENGYPYYQRRANQSTRSIPDRSFRGSRYEVGNQWVIPHNAYLPRRFRAHINVKFCPSGKAIKYIHKYVYKASDRTTISLHLRNNEVARNLHSRYIGPTEATWRLFEFPTHEEFPPVQTLAVHLPGEQIVYFDPKFANVLGHNAQYAEWLSKLSYDPALQRHISLPEYVSQTSQLEDLYVKVFPKSELHNLHSSPDFWRTRAILTLFNEAVLAMNMALLLRFAGVNYEVFSEDLADGNHI